MTVVSPIQATTPNISNPVSPASTSGGASSVASATGGIDSSTLLALLQNPAIQQFLQALEQAFQNSQPNSANPTGATAQPAVANGLNTAQAGGAMGSGTPLAGAGGTPAAGGGDKLDAAISHLQKLGQYQQMLASAGQTHASPYPDRANMSDADRSALDTANPGAMPASELAWARAHDVKDATNNPGTKFWANRMADGTLF